jgi:hypothetical protein
MVEFDPQLQQTQSQMSLIRNEIDNVVKQMDRMTDIMSKFRDFTSSEVRELSDFKDMVSKIATEYDKLNPGEITGKGAFTGVLLAMESQMEPVKKAVDYYTKQIKQLQDETAAQTKQIQDSQAKGRENITKKSVLENLSTQKMTKDTKSKIQWELGTEEKDPKKLRTLMKKKIEDTETENKGIIAAVENSRKQLTVRQQEIPKIQEKLDKEKKVLAVQKLQYKQMEDFGRLAKRRMQEQDEYSRRSVSRRGRAGIVGGALQLASDMNLPGVSQAATLARYTGRGAEIGEEAGGGMMGKLGGGLAGLGMAAGVLGVGYAATQGYKTYQTAHQLARPMTQLGGVMGQGNAGNIRGLMTNEAMTKMGYGGMENLQTMMQLGRTVSPRAVNQQNMEQMSRMARTTGAERGELVQQMGGMVAAGGATAGGAMVQLGRVMEQAVKAGMDQSKTVSLFKLL